MDTTETEDVKLEIEPEPEPDPAVPSPETAGDPASEAFARLQGELALMRRAVEHLASERADIVIPDYGKTLTGMAKSLNEMDERLEAMADHPALQITPESIGARVAAAAEFARRTDQERINIARADMQQVVHDLRSITASARSAADQQRKLYRMAGGGLLAGILLWSFLPGTIARAMPESWQWPERMAARMVGAPSAWDAGARIMEVGNPEAWGFLVRASRIELENRKLIMGCVKRAKANGQSVGCSVSVSPSSE